jgi:hypothetical protein
LLELSLEQVALASMLYFRIVAEESGISARLRAGETLPPIPANAPPLLSLLAHHISALNDESILRASRHHRPSLAELDFVFELLPLLVVHLVDPSVPPPSGAATAPGHYRLALAMLRRRSIGRRFVTTLQENLNEVRALDLGRLDETVKNQSLYARVDTATGRVSLPAVDHETGRTIERCSHTVENFLRGILKRRALDARGPPELSEA